MNSRVEFFKLRKKVNEAIRHAWANGEPGKPYDGEWEVTCCYAGAYEGRVEFREEWKIELHCYLLGPGRHYFWLGRTFEAALKQCKADVEEWCRQEMEGADDEDPA